MNETQTPATASPINKQYIIIGVVVVLLLIGGGAFFMMRGGSEQAVPEQKMPTEEKLIPTVDSSVEVDLKSLPSGKLKKMQLSVNGIPDGTKSIDYEITYETKDGGLQGVSSSIETGGKDTYEKDFELGTCSAGGKCVSHEVTGAIKVSLKFSGSYGEQIFEKEFELE